MEPESFVQGQMWPTELFSCLCSVASTSWTEVSDEGLTRDEYRDYLTHPQATYSYLYTQDSTWYHIGVLIHGLLIQLYLAFTVSKQKEKSLYCPFCNLFGLFAKRKLFFYKWIPNLSWSFQEYEYGEERTLILMMCKSKMSWLWPVSWNHHLGTSLWLLMEFAFLMIT